MEYILALIMSIVLTPTAPSSIEAAVNNERQQNGVQSLRSSKKLREGACEKAQHMLDNQYWSHDAPDGTEPWSFFKIKYDRAGENLARGFSDEEKAVAGWMNSPTHRENVLGDFTSQGICTKHGVLMGQQTSITVQHLTK